MSEIYVLNPPAGLSCPECGGTLSKIDGEAIPQYACHIGHVLTGEAMLQAQADRIEFLLGGALAVLNERRELCRQLLADGLTEAATLEAILGRATKTASQLLEILNENGSY